jgi:hypothetical protein
MTREQSVKSKNKLSQSSKEEQKSDKSDEGVSTRADPTERAMSGIPAQPHSLQSTTRAKEPQDRQIEEPSSDLQESERVSEQTLPNGYQDIEDDWVMHRRIAERAFLLFEADGCKHGKDWAHWFEAERRINDTQV